MRRSPPAHADTTIIVEDRTYRVEQYENVMVGAGQQVGEDWDRLEHMKNVGLLHHHHHGPSQPGQVKNKKQLFSFIAEPKEE